MSLLGRALVVSGLLAACSTSHPLPANYAPTEAAISAADAIGAQQDPRAALHLKMARDQLAEAQTLTQKGDSDKAVLACDRARTDAELALMVKRESDARNETNQSKAAVERLGTQ
ncbi:MAG TPA: DUF4398 domain-containing protein [Polyangiaceae bacterium]|nr:DUF4398 domain-containing protein [Polyangiaceae bacterium]